MSKRHGNVKDLPPLGVSHERQRGVPEERSRGESDYSFYPGTVSKRGTNTRPKSVDIHDYTPREHTEKCSIVNSELNDTELGSSPVTYSDKQYQVAPNFEGLGGLNRRMDRKGMKNIRPDVQGNVGSRNLRSPLLGLRHTMCSPAPRERESSDDSMDSPRSPLALDKSSSGKKAGAFPSIKVEKCDGLPPLRQSSASSDTGGRAPGTPVSAEAGHNLFVPSPVHQKRSQDGRIVVVTSNLESLKNFSKSEGDLEEALTKCTLNSHNENKSKKLDAKFRPQKVTRPKVHLTSGQVKEEIKTLDMGQSPSQKRRIRLVPLQQSSRAKSDNDLSAT